VWMETPVRRMDAMRLMAVRLRPSSGRVMTAMPVRQMTCVSQGHVWLQEVSIVMMEILVRWMAAIVPLDVRANSIPMNVMMGMFVPSMTSV